MSAEYDNRAAAACFRLWGGRGRQTPGEARVIAKTRPMHRGERAFLAVWMPFAVWVAAADLLGRWLAVAPSLLLAVPLGFVALNLLPFALGGAGPGSQWRRWLLAGAFWAVFHLDATGIVALTAWGWILLAGANVLAAVLLALKSSMLIGGGMGVAWRIFLLLAFHGLIVAVFWRCGWAWGLACGAVVGAALCRAVLNPGCQWLGPVIRRTGDSGILVTIDDGPDPEDTPVLLDLLDRHRMKAVFFMIGSKVAMYPDLVRHVVARGHEIGNHTMTHPQVSFWCAGPRRTRREILDCQRLIEEVTGVKPRYFRAPVGHRNLFTHPIAAELGLEVMAWSRRGFDAVERDVAMIVNRITRCLRPGDIVLVHESTPVAAKVLEGVLESAEAVARKS